MSTPTKAPFASLDTRLPLPAVTASNPFTPFTSSAPEDVPADAPEGSYTYALVQSAPSVPAAECEVDAAAVEIVIRWGATTLHVAHLAPVRSFLVGEASDKDAVDFELPADRLGVARLPVVRKAPDGSVRAVIPAGAKGTATVAGQIVKVSELRAGSHGAASAEIAGAIEMPIQTGTKVRFEIGGIEIEIASVNAGRKVAARFSFDRRGLPFQAISMALHLGLLGTAAVLMPPMALASEDSLPYEQIDTLKMALSASAERELDAVKDQVREEDKGPRDSHPGDSSPSDGRRVATTPSRGAPGKSGTFGPSADPGVPLTRDETVAMARKFGMIQLLDAMPSSAATTPWGQPIGTDPRGSMAMFSGDITEPGGGNGLDLSGTGDGAGGDGTGIKTDRTAMFGPNVGPALFGPGNSMFRRGHRQSPLSMRAETPNTSGPIPRELIQRVVRQNFGRFRFCYEDGLRRNPELAGRVSVRFVIGRDGGVMSSANGGSDLPDAGVVSCVVASFRGLSFPQGENASIATVTYPIMFSPAK